MKKVFLVVILSGLFFNPLFGQKEFDEESETAFSDRVYFGGNFGLQFGSITAIDISPLVGYMITNRLSAGVGATYQYLKYKSRYNNQSFSTNIYGGRLFARYNLTEQFFAHSEYEVLNLDFYDAIGDQRRRENVPGIFVGGGYFQPIGSRAGISITALYNLLHDNRRSPYASPLVLRVGFNL